MATKSPRGRTEAESLDDIVRAIREGGPGPYLLLGDNGLDREEIARRVVEELTPEATRPFNYDVFHADERECSAEAIATATAAYPVIADVRVVVVRGLEDARDELGAELARLASGPLDGTVLLMLGEKLDGRRKWAATLLKASRTFTLAAPKGRAFTAWLRRRATRHGVQLADGAAEMLAEYVGADVYRAASEVEKLALYVAPRETVEVEDVEAVVGITREDTVYNLTDRIAELNAGGALAIAHRMVQADQHPAYLVGMIVRYWERLRVATDLIQHGREKELGALTGENRPFILNKYLSQARLLRRERVRMGFRLALAAESAIKGGWPPEVVLDGLICQLAAPQTT